MEIWVRKFLIYLSNRKIGMSKRRPKKHETTRGASPPSNGVELATEQAGRLKRQGIGVS